MASDPIVSSGYIYGGRLNLRNRKALAKRLASWKDGEVTVRIERAHATRSLPQNAWYWGCILALLSEHTGYTVDEMHDVCKAKFIPKRLALQDGNGEIQGEYVIGGTTTRLNKIQFGEYCEAIRSWAAQDLGCVIPDPHEW